MASFILVRDEVSEPLANFPKEALFYIHEFMTEEVFWREPWNDDMKAKNENGAYSKLKISHLERMRNWVEEEKIWECDPDYRENNNLDDWMTEYKEYTLNSIDRAIAAMKKGYSIEYVSPHGFEDTITW